MPELETVLPSADFVIEGCIVRHNTIEQFGPVRVVKVELVFELAFEGTQESTRHKAGIVVRFPRINRWWPDKKPAGADALETLKAMARRSS